MGASDIRAGGAYVEASLDTKKLEGGLDKAETSVENFGNDASAMAQVDASLDASALAVGLGQAGVAVDQFSIGANESATVDASLETATLDAGLGEAAKSVQDFGKKAALDAKVKLSVDPTLLEQGLQKAKTGVAQFEGYMKNVAATIAKSFFALFAAQKLLTFVTDSVSAAAEQEKAEKELAAAIERTGGTIKRTAADVKNLAKARQEVTLFSDEATLAAATVLARFEDLNGENFDAAIIASQDLATVMGTDLSSAANALGHALNNPEKAAGLFAATGNKLTETEKNMLNAMIAAGDSASAHAFILSRLNDIIGGASEKAADGYSGKLEQMQKSFNGLKETIGGLIIGPLTSFMEWLNNALKRLTMFIEKIKEVGKAMSNSFAGKTFGKLASFWENWTPQGNLFKGIKALGAPLPKAEQKKPKLRTDFSQYEDGEAGADAFDYAGNLADSEEDGDVKKGKPLPKGKLPKDARERGLKSSIDKKEDVYDPDDWQGNLGKLNESFTKKIGQALVGGLNTFAGAAMGTFSARGAGQIGLDPQKEQVDILKNIREILTENNKLIGKLDNGGLAV